MSEKRPIAPKWEGPFPKATAAAAHAVSEATSTIVRPLERPVRKFFTRATGFDKEYSSNNTRNADPIAPRTGPNPFRDHDASGIETKWKLPFPRTVEAAGHAVSDVSSRVREPITRTVGGFFRRTTGFDKDYTEIARNNRVKERQGQERRLERLGWGFERSSSESDQDRTLREVVTIFELQHPPSQVVKFRRDNDK